MINNVTLIGRLTRDAELRYTPSNIATAQFNVACNRNFKNANGEYDADFINCVMWREQAERFCNWTKKECWSELREEFRLEVMKETMENVYM
nr:MAG TPA: Single strand binding protein [Caudoviricetes sp.]